MEGHVAHCDYRDTIVGSLINLHGTGYGAPVIGP